MDNRFIFEILGDDPKNIENINQTMFDIQRSTFSELSKAQESMCNVYKYTYSFSDGMYDRNRYVFNVPYSFIEGSKRLDVRYSAYYKKEISHNTLYSHPELFDVATLVFVGGKLYTNYYIRPMEDSVQIRFGAHSALRRDFNDGFTVKEIAKFIENGTKITVVVVPMCRYSSGQIISRQLTASMRFDELDATFTSSNSLTNGRCPFVFVSGDINDTVVPGYNYVSSSIIDGTCYVNTPNLPPVTNAKVLYNVQNTYLENIHTVTVVDASGWFYLDLEDMPGSPNNILVFDELDNGLVTFDHDATITMYYPNIYKIESNHTGTFMITSFYNKNIEPYRIKHVDELSLYRLFCARIDTYDLSEAFANNTVPAYVETYQPISTDYGIEDYNANPLYEQPLSYKIKTLRNLIYQNPRLYSLYLERFVDKYPMYEVNVTNEYLADKRRTSTEQDIPNMEPVVFDEPKIVFAVDRFEFISGVAVFVDNKFIHINNVYFTDDAVYTYIDYSVISNDSTVQIYLLGDYRYTRDITLDSSIANKISLAIEYFTRPEDIYLTRNVDGSDILITEGYYLCEKIDIDTREILTDDVELDGEYYRPIDENYFVKYPELYILCDESLNGVTVTVHTDKFSFVSTNYDEAADLTINANINKGKRNFMVYRDGRLLSPMAIHLIHNSTNAAGPHRLRMNVFIDPGMGVDVWHTTEKYNLVCEYHDEEKNIKRLRLYQRYLDVDDGDISGRTGNIYDKQFEAIDRSVGDISSFVDNFYYVKNPVEPGIYEIKSTYGYYQFTVRRRCLPGSWFALDTDNNILIYYDSDKNNTNRISIGSPTDDSATDISTVTVHSRYVDFTNLITKPIDFRWYDIYLNGLKLTEKDVIVLAPYKMLILVDDDYPDIDTFIYVDLIDFILDHVIYLDMINPDLDQITPLMVEEYPELMDENTNLMLDPDISTQIRANIILDPDREEGYLFPTAEVITDV